jgi:DNA-binding transcriptional regulator YiaG
MLSSRPKLTHAQEAATLRSGRPLPELLHEMRVERSMTIADIAYELRVTHVTVAKWLRQFGISRDDRPAIEMPAEASA